MSEQHAPASTRKGVDRRAVVRAGVWTVPAVTLATAAPAFAATSVTNGKLLFNFLTIAGVAKDSKGKPTQGESTASIQNVAGAHAPTLTSVVMSVIYSGGRADGSAPTIISGTGWSFSGAAVSGPGSWTYTFVWTGSLAPGSSTPTLTWRVPIKNSSSGSMSISAHVTATGATAADLTATTNL